jgi:phage replication O-like protein O
MRQWLESDYFPTMTKPQLENGYTRIANEILEALVKVDLSGTELKIVLCVMRRTYGFGKKQDWISYTQFEKMTGKARPNIWKSIEKLVTKRLLVTKKQPGRTFYSFNKDYSQWVVTKTKLVTKRKRTSYDLETQVVTKLKPTKETITKETIQKKDTPAQTMRNFTESIKEKDELYSALSEKLSLEKNIEVNKVRAELDKFVSYWTELNKSGTKQRWELEKTFEVQRRLVTWFSRASSYKSVNKPKTVSV